MSAIAQGQDAETLRSLREVEDLYAAQAGRVRRLVGLRVVAGDGAVEDACQIAWTRLVARRDTVRRDAAVRWLVAVATHEVWHARARERCDVPFEAIGEESPDPSPPPSEVSAQRQRLRAIDGLPPRQQRLVWLQGFGFSYAEMSRRTGESRRTVERQLLRARRRLAEADAA